MYYTGIDPFTKKKVETAKSLKDRKLQRALMQFFKPENYFEVREALLTAGRQDLIGSGCDCLIPDKPPKEAIQRRREDANARFRGEYVHTIRPVDGQSPGSPSPGGQNPAGQKKGSKKSSRHQQPKGYRPKPPKGRT
jgi:hypothetical protein